MKPIKHCTWCGLFNLFEDWRNCCDECVAEQTKKYSTKPVMGEWSRKAQTERNEFAKDILQPLKKDGTVNKHFVEAHGTKTLQKELKLKPRQIRENIEKYG